MNFFIVMICIIILYKYVFEAQLYTYDFRRFLLYNCLILLSQTLFRVIYRLHFCFKEIIMFE